MSPLGLGALRPLRLTKNNFGRVEFCVVVMLEARKHTAPTKVAEHKDVCASFFAQVRQASKRALMLDYDGTLSPFTPDRSRAFPYRGIPGLVSQIMQHNTRV